MFRENKYKEKQYNNNNNIFIICKVIYYIKLKVALQFRNVTVQTAKCIVQDLHEKNNTYKHLQTPTNTYKHILVHPQTLTHLTHTAK